MYSEKPKLHERNQLHKPGTLRTISLDVTSLCNMKCSHCYAEPFMNAIPAELELFRKATSELYDLGVFHYILQGGEPICDQYRLEAIISMIHPDETYINVVSNGYAMTKNIICWLKELKVDKICFSLDSGLEEEHDKNRLPGSFKKVMRAIDHVLEEGLLTSISITVTHQSLYSEGFRKAYEFIKNKKIRIDVQIAEPVGKWDGRKDLLITPEDAEYIKELQLDSPILDNGQQMVKRDIFSGSEDHCPAGKEFMAITVDGYVLPCNFLQYSLGNIRNKSFREMRDNLLTSDYFQGLPNCLCGENEEFINNFIMPYTKYSKPLDAHKVFNLKGVII